uniref:Mitochondrial fission process protein 1 n=1 Tax=Chromera velia CCMP2878 TaxID=1169474 RepID=A0A0G4FUR6_9ALVE|eukprot:Cvel_3770.t1-p1 / transcript=Cvel_3770.t1 / gene=Cvel_3770 / organism=Chromera_velia_CCMP2878 / gene_product=Mitochondrial fission process protein 1, putative / transcript_product=Mitochondrial fission process protein 1, putative / location=Cvel_scaffold158:25808-27769(+) / protein_length=280 / sequence_SO=supercontig / SO=protein_coding / is_pseudo=false
MRSLISAPCAALFFLAAETEAFTPSAVRAFRHANSRSSSRLSPAASENPATSLKALEQLEALNSLLVAHGELEPFSAQLVGQVLAGGSLIAAGKALELGVFKSGGADPEVLEEEVEEETADIFRDTPVRYLGYANEVGEAFRPLVPVELVNLSYAVAFAYIFADSAAKGKQCAENPERSRSPTPPVAVIDCLIFQILASVVFPSFNINRIVALVGTQLEQIEAIANSVGIPTETADYVPTLVGLAIIPFIAPPLDTFVEEILDLTYRPATDNLFGKAKEA